MLIQCTKKLLNQLNIRPESGIEEEPLFSWHANLVTVSRRKAVVLVNDKNRYVIVIHGLKAKDFKRFDDLVIQGIRNTFKRECIKDSIVDKFINYSNKITYAKTKDKSSVAKMNKACEMLYYYEDLLDSDSIYKTDLSLEASRYFIGDGQKGYIKPNEEMYKDLRAFAGEPIFSTQAVKLKVTLDLEKHRVLRRLVVPVNITFDKLHKVLQVAFDWMDYHLHEFYIYDDKSKDNGQYGDDQFINHPAYNKEGYEPVVKLACDEEAFDYPDEIDMRLETGIQLSEYIPKNKRLKYIYDFGDNWQHYIEVEKVVDDYDKNFPVCLEGEGNTPPEDVGGKYGYEEFLESIGDQNHPDYANMLEWGKSQGFKTFDIESVNRKLKHI